MNAQKLLRAIACALLCSSLLSYVSPVAAVETQASVLLHDAELTSVQFINADRGWAVGDRGAIWHTRDGGRSWKLQASPVDCRLEAVQFLDDANGWIVGSVTQPYSHVTKAVLLKTKNAGQQWTEIRTDTLPGLRGLKFFDAKNGWIWGDASGLYPSGLFRTNDGGQSWTPISKGNTTGWITGDFRDHRSGAVAGQAGELGLVAGVEIRPSRTTDLGLRYLRQLKLTSGTGGWLIGEGGLALTTNDSGFTWTATPGALPSASAYFDFRGIAVSGTHCWIAGSPGTFIFHSPDSGQTWKVQRTDQFAPLRSITFLDENRGWAVGALGTILATRDGGQTWVQQRNGGTRAAMLGVFSKPDRIPWEVVASTAGNDGYLTVFEILGRQDRDGQGPANVSLPRRTHDALVAVGGSSADTSWQFPLRAPGSAQSATSILAYWNEFSDGQATRNATAHLVRRIRTWRPEVIVTEDISPRGDNPLAHVTNQLVLAAVQQAADATFAPEQISHAGLEPWKVKKVYSVQPGNRSGALTISAAQWAPRLGGSVGEYAQRGSGLISADYDRGPAQIGLSLMLDHLPQQMGRRDVFSGIALIPGGEARRELPEIVQENLEALSKAAQKRHNVQQLLTQADQSDSAAASWLGQADDLTKGLSNQSAGEVLFQLAQKYQQTGKTQAANDALQRLFDKYPQHPLAHRAAVILIQQAVSGEMAARERHGTNYEVKLATATTPLEETPREVRQNPQAPLPRALGPVTTKTVGDTQRTTAAPQQNAEDRATRAIALGKQLEKLNPALVMDPAVRFPLAVAHRLAGNDRQTERMLETLSSLGEQNPWAQAVAAEHWRRHANGLPPKKLFTCVAASSRPQLDGLLDDPLWQTAKRVQLRTQAQDDAAWPAIVVAAWDKEFLYFAVSATKVAGVNYPTDDKPRPRDSDLLPFDHVRLHLDIDRDYSTHYTLAIDSRGFTAESCVGDKSWNPNWFVASAGDDKYWTAEVAIPWSELTDKPPLPTDLWAVGVERLVPGQPLQSFTQPATTTVRPEGFGLWLFQ